MKLIEFKYFDGFWKLENFKLSEVNLVVGKNAVGKSRTIKGLNDTIQVLLQGKDIKSNEVFYAILLFINELNDSIIYGFNYQNGKIIQEDFIINGVAILKRDEKKTLLNKEIISPPNNKLTLHVRRDIKEHPYFEKIMQWAENSYGIVFNEADFIGGRGKKPYLMVQGEGLYDMLNSLSEESVERVIKAASIMEYSITKIEAVDDVKAVRFYEKDVKIPLWDFNLSKGMFRTLHLLIFLEYLSTLKAPQMLAIDDFCEGLDYERATKLGKYVFDFCLEHDIQLIASSNDSFLMGVVDVKYWNILQREGSIVKAINYQNNPELFDNFELIGLNNFDLFSSDYIARYTAKKKA
ncbi:AAA family ATPase [Paludibacter sp. 221]|uniref:AAA family ATPase n=1 Tax=Paludibacter sp. 221 TaxID=2302939 RepID=UPI0013D6F10D